MGTQGHSEVDAGCGRSDGARPFRALTVVRWLLVLPAAVAGSALTLWVLYALAERRYPFLQPTWFVLLAIGLAAVAFVVPGALMAPSRRRLVGLVAASVFTCGALALSLVVALSSNWSFAASPGWAIVALSIAVAAAYGAALVVGGQRA